MTLGDSDGTRDSATLEAELAWSVAS
jgi:hypothetical protein